MGIVAEDTLNVKVKISRDRVVEVDLYNELDIDVNNIRQELIKQPAKFATWAVLSDLAEQRLARLLAEQSIGGESVHLLDRIYIAEKQCEFFSSIKNVFSHRKSTLLHLWENPKQERVMTLYQQDLSHLRALLKDIVPYLSPQN